MKTFKKLVWKVNYRGYAITMTNNSQMQGLNTALLLIHITHGIVCVWCGGKGSGQGSVPLRHWGEGGKFYPVVHFP